MKAEHCHAADIAADCRAADIAAGFHAADIVEGYCRVVGTAVECLHAAESLSAGFLLVHCYCPDWRVADFVGPDMASLRYLSMCRDWCEN